MKILIINYLFRLKNVMNVIATAYIILLKSFANTPFCYCERLHCNGVRCGVVILISKLTESGIIKVCLVEDGHQKVKKVIFGLQGNGEFCAFEINIIVNFKLTRIWF